MKSSKWPNCQFFQEFHEKVVKKSDTDTDTESHWHHGHGHGVTPTPRTRGHTDMQISKHPDTQTCRYRNIRIHRHADTKDSTQRQSDTKDSTPRQSDTKWHHNSHSQTPNDTITVTVRHQTDTFNTKFSHNPVSIESLDKLVFLIHSGVIGVTVVSLVSVVPPWCPFLSVLAFCRNPSLFWPSFSLFCQTPKHRVSSVSHKTTKTTKIETFSLKPSLNTSRNNENNRLLTAKTTKKTAKREPISEEMSVLPKY